MLFESEKPFQNQNIQISQNDQEYTIDQGKAGKFRPVGEVVLWR